MSPLGSKKFRCTAFLAVTIDGHIARANGDIDFLPPPPTRIKGKEQEESDDKAKVPTHEDMLERTDLLVMGRNTYETVCGFCKAGSIPSRSEEAASERSPWPYGTTPLLILTSQGMAVLPDCPDPQVQIDTARDLDEVISFIDKAEYKNIWVDGGQTVRSFLAGGLIDDLVLTTVGVLLGCEEGEQAGLSLWCELRLREDVHWSIAASEVMNGLMGVHWKAVRK